GTAECADEDQVFTGSLDVVADGVVVASKPVKITVPACRWHHSTEMICGQQRGGEGHDGGGEGRATGPPVAGRRYAAAVTISNPSTGTGTLGEDLAELIPGRKRGGREAGAGPARPFAGLPLRPGEATLEDCWPLEECIGPASGQLELGVLDIVA